MAKKETLYHAIPILLYVPRTPEGGEEEARKAEFEAVELLNTRGGWAVFIAEDYDTTPAVETEDDDLSAMIGTACTSSI